MNRITATVLLLVLFVAGCVFSHSCANTTTAPGGGPKDTLPPVLLKITPGPGQTGFPQTEGKITLLFNEYTVVKNAGDILLSPPTRHKPTAKVKGKNIVVTLPDTLREDQTYTLDFGQALADNNEGNLAPRMVYPFSTGETIDSLYFTGSVLGCKTLTPVKNMLVAAYLDPSDSACFKTMPDAVVKTDDWGFFVLRNLRDTTYSLYVYTDTDLDFKYNPDEDEIGFLDSLYRPVTAISDTIYELRSFNMKDTLLCSLRVPMVTLLTFKELQTVQYLQNSGRTSEKQGFLKFSAADVQIERMEFVGIPDSSVILQYNATRDSIDFWINTDYRLDDSLLVRFTYLKTDSTGVLAPAEESLSLAVTQPESENTGNTGRQLQKGPNQAGPDTAFQLQIQAQDETVEQLGVRLESALPIIHILRDSLQLWETNPKGQKAEKTFSFRQDTSELRRYIILPTEQLLKGYDYELTIPQGTFINLDRLPNAAATAKFKIPQADNLSLLEIDLTGVDERYIVELTDEKGSKVFRTYHVDHSEKLSFPYLKAGKYMIRITCDQNRNGLIDTGNLLERKQPETVRFYESTPGNKVLEIPESAEIEQAIDLKEMFR
ncbi:MAG: Ig-like domain-containing protein [Bacteroidales bacterium]|nr:Ig-like domain-containing protein [Bacteroidales bacterium]